MNHLLKIVLGGMLLVFLSVVLLNAQAREWTAGPDGKPVQVGGPPGAGSGQAVAEKPELSRLIAVVTVVGVLVSILWFIFHLWDRSSEKKVGWFAGGLALVNIGGWYFREKHRQNRVRAPQYLNHQQLLVCHLVGNHFRFHRRIRVQNLVGVQ